MGDKHISRHAISENRMDPQISYGYVQTYLCLNFLSKRNILNLNITETFFVV